MIKLNLQTVFQADQEVHTEAPKELSMQSIRCLIRVTPALTKD